MGAVSYILKNRNMMLGDFAWKGYLKFGRGIVLVECREIEKISTKYGEGFAQWTVKPM